MENETIESFARYRISKAKETTLSFWLIHNNQNNKVFLTSRKEYLHFFFNLAYKFYKIIQMSAPLPSLTIRSKVSCNLIWASSGILKSLVCNPSLTSSCKLFPKIKECSRKILEKAVLLRETIGITTNKNSKN